MGQNVAPVSCLLPHRQYVSGRNTAEEVGTGPLSASLTTLPLFLMCIIPVNTGVMNVAADALSRDNLILFSSLLPQASPSTVPALVINLLLTHKPDWGSHTWIDMFAGTLAAL